mmetsp:Transcript_24775/g.40607  ORF Transcript_24775/g.40607 Transcript_24775/m.40607 type:complete len:287 (-) Transcript_24775:95-955(-)
MYTSMMNEPQSSLSPEQQAMTLARLLSRRRWTLLETILTSTSSSALLIDDPSLPHAVTSDIVIHFATRFQAPLRIISLLSQKYPQSLASSDITGRYPIHVACKWASTPDIIAYLIKTNPSVVGVPDSIGKVPMHYVGEFYLQHFNHGLYGRDDSMLQVVRLLKTASPQSVNIEDNEGMNAIEYALECNVNLKVIKLMQRASRDDWRERGKSNNIIDGDENAATGQKPQLGRRRHRDLVRDMETMALKLQMEISSDRVMDRKMSNNDRIHVHRSRTLEATTRAARTA